MLRICPASQRAILPAVTRYLRDSVHWREWACSCGMSSSSPRLIRQGHLWSPKRYAYSSSCHLGIMVGIACSPVRDYGAITNATPCTCGSGIYSKWVKCNTECLCGYCTYAVTCWDTSSFYDKRRFICWSSYGAMTRRVLLPAKHCEPCKDHCAHSECIMTLVVSWAKLWNWVYPSMFQPEVVPVIRLCHSCTYLF